jgi:hypothetical protein
MQPQQMAQTLDDLDRALAAQSQAGESTGQQASQPSGQQAGQPQPGQQPSGQQPSGQPSSSQPSSSQSSPGQDASGPASAMDASPTLAQMLEAAMQQAARERMQSLQQAQGGERSGDPSTDAANANPLSESGQGDPPGGIDEIDLLRDAMQDGDWGDLRERGVDDAAQGRGSRVPPGYSREVRAYFRALSKRAAESEE